MVAYHVIHTVILWWFGVWDPVLLSSIKELIRFGGILFALLRRRKQARACIGNWKWLIVGLLVLVARSIWVSVYHQVSVMTMIVGIKYDLLPLLILVSAMFLGTLLDTNESEKIFKGLWSLCLLVVVGWLVRQLAKIYLPDVMAILGYGPVGDYALASAPPLYYRTWPGGWMRLQGIFSWPNNYGYFLVAYFSVVMGVLFAKNKWGKNTFRFKWWMVLLFLGSALRTLSRGVWVGIGVQVFLLIWLFKPWWKKRLGRLVWIGLAGIIWLSVLKPASTIGHLNAWTEGRQDFIVQPLGHGLGSAWPAIHRDGVYLPENHYLQLLLDIGIPWLLLRLWVVWGVIVCGWNRNLENDVSILRMFLLLGFVGLLVEGLFLHVFEDSMVNYLFLVVVGIVVGMQKRREPSLT